MRFLKELCRFFVQITTGILIICAINYSVWGNGELPANILWQIVLSGAVTAVITEIVMSLPEPETKKRFGFIHRSALCCALHSNVGDRNAVRLGIKNSSGSASDVPERGGGICLYHGSDIFYKQA